MKETWNFIHSGKCCPAYNMALDEALLEWHSKGEISPTIRFYGWDPATLSIGYFQKVDKEINMDAVNKYRLGFVRRPTGGRGVLHEHELTYSVVVSESHPKMPSGITEAYRVISEGVLEGFKNLGLNAYFAIPRSEAEKENLKRPRSAVCFDAPSWYELVVEGKKVAGSAQTRQKGVILQHGSIILDLEKEKLFELFKFSNERVKERLLKGFEKKAVAINDLLQDQGVSFDEAVLAFKKGFEQGLGIHLNTFSLNEDQENYVKYLVETRYSKPEWNFRK